MVNNIDCYKQRNEAILKVCIHYTIDKIYFLTHPCLMISVTVVHWTQFLIEINVRSIQYNHVLMLAFTELRQVPSFYMLGLYNM